MTGTKVKRPLNAYFLFSKDRRPELKKANPDKRMGSLSKLIGSEWKALSDKKKASYVQKAKDLKAEYEKAQEV